MADNSLTLSVLLLAHGPAPELRRCLLSIAADRLEAVEIVVVDDANPTPVALDLEGIRYPVTLLRNTRRRGAVASRNRAALAALGEVLIFLAPDVTLSQGSLRAVERAFAADPLAGVVVGHTLGTLPAGRAAPLHAFESGLIAVRSSLFRDSGGFSEGHSRLGTLEFVMRLAHAGVRMVHRPSASVLPQRGQSLHSLASSAYRHGLAWRTLAPARRGLDDLLTWSSLRDAATCSAPQPPRHAWRQHFRSMVQAVFFLAGCADAFLREPQPLAHHHETAPFRTLPRSTRDLRETVWRPQPASRTR